MSFAQCLAQLEAEGTIDAKRAERFRALYDQMEGRFKRQYGATPGEVLAGEEALRALEWDAQLRRRQAALQIEAQRRAFADMEKFDRGSGKKDSGAIIAMMARDDRAPYRSIEGHTEILDFQAHAMLDGFLDKHSRNLLGTVRDKAGLDDVLRARHGDKVDNIEARAFSDAIGEVLEMQRQRFNLLGGDIGHDAKYGITHRHDARRVRAVAFEQWHGDILPELDQGRMIDPLTGGKFSPENLEEALRAVYETIRTDGLSGLGSGESGGARKLANRRSDARFLQFRDGDGWLRYNAKYGAADPFTAIMNQIHGMNRDIAMLERFGPNPDATVRWLTDQAQRRLAQSGDPSPTALNLAQGLPESVEKVWAMVNGAADIPVLGGPLRTGITKGLHGARDIITAAKLGKAVLTALGDLATVNAAKRYSKIPQSSTMLGYLKQLNPLDASDRKLAVQLELGMRDASAAMLGLNRYLGKTQSPAITKVIADSSLRITGLNAFTEAGQRHFGLSFLGELAHVRGADFAGLRPELRASMQRYGIDAADWEVMRRAPVHAERGGEWMAGPLVRKADPAVAEKMMDMVLSETAAAVQMSTVRGRALTTFGRPGTFAGEAGRSLFQFKTFTASLMLQQGQRITAMGGLQLGGIYAARLIIGLTLFGAATIQLRQISYGQDLRPVDDWEFWTDALLQGGGAAIFGDVIGSFTREGQSGPADVVGGPLFGAVWDLGKATAGNAARALRGDETHVLRDLTKFARKNTPGSNTWYASTAIQRLIFDQLEELADPNIAANRARMERTAAEQGTEYFWAPGQAAPTRAPDFANAFEGTAP